MFGVKLLGNLRRRHAPRTGDLGKVGRLRAAFLRDDFVYLELRCNLCFDHLLTRTVPRDDRPWLLGCVISSTVVGVMNIMLHSYLSNVQFMCNLRLMFRIGSID